MPRIVDAAVMINNAYLAYNDAQGVPQLRDSNEALPLDGGWTLVKFVDNTSKGGDAAAIFQNQNTNEIFIAGRGTATGTDFIPDFGIWLRQAPEQRIADAKVILAKVREDNPDSVITAGGHSLDGEVWAKVSQRDDQHIDVLAINAPNSSSANDIYDDSHVTSISAAWDIVGHYGPDYSNAINLDSGGNLIRQDLTHSIYNTVINGIANNSALANSQLGQVDPIAVIGDGVEAIRWNGTQTVPSNDTLSVTLNEDDSITAISNPAGSPLTKVTIANDGSYSTEVITQGAAGGSVVDLKGFTATGVSQYETVYATDATVILGDGVTALITGSGNTITAGDNASLSITGSDNITEIGSGTISTYDPLTGVLGYDYVNADGSSSGTRLNLDGTSINYTNDGQGHITNYNYYLLGNLTASNTETFSYHALGSDPTEGQTVTKVQTTYYYDGGSTESKAFYSYSDGDSATSYTVTRPDGAYQSSITTIYDGGWAINTRDTTNADGSYQRVSNVYGDIRTSSRMNLGAGATESTNRDFYAASGLSYTDHTVTQSDGSYQGSWTANNPSNGVDYYSNGVDYYSSATGVTWGSGNYVMADYSYTFTYDKVPLASGATEFKETDTYADGSTESVDTVSYGDYAVENTYTYTNPDGSRQIFWSKRDGSWGTADYSAATGVTSGTVNDPTAGYTETFSTTSVVGGATESNAIYRYSDGSTATSDTVTQPDGSYQSTWSKQDGSYSSTVNDGQGNVVSTVYDATGIVLGTATGSMAQQILPAGASAIQLASGISSADLAISEDSQGNFLMSYNNGAGTLEIPAQSAISSPVVASFANGTSWQFVNADGNPYSCTAGSGVVYLINPSDVQFGAGITSDMVTLGLGSLMLHVGSNNDVLHIEGFNPTDALNSNNGMDAHYSKRHQSAKVAVQ